LAKSKGKGFLLFEGVKPSKDRYLFKIIGEEEDFLHSIGYEYVILLNPEARVQLKISYKDRDKNKRIFKNLENNHKKEIEKEFKNELKWSPNGLRERPDCIYSLISSVVADKGLRDKDYWDCTQQKMIDAMKRFSEAFDKPVDKVTENE